jgi:acetolactate decarboxylase
MPEEGRFIHFLHALHLHRAQTDLVHARVGEIDNRRAHEIFQTSTINALLEGVYDGDMTFGELRQHGDFGLGTFNALDGEMIALEGEFFQIKSDGEVYPVEDDQKTPFAVVQYFEADTNFSIDTQIDFNQLKSKLESELPIHNFFYAIRIDGLFKYMKMRSVPRQNPPYPQLVDVVKNQPEFELFDVQGTLAGFRFPDYTQGVNVPGYHLHFLSENRKSGGHVLDCHLINGNLAAEHTSNFHMELPTQGAILDADLSKDQSAAINQVEQ